MSQYWDPDCVHISCEAFQSASCFIILYLCVGACDFILLHFTTYHACITTSLLDGQRFYDAPDASDHAGLVMICYDQRLDDTPDVSDHVRLCDPMWSDIEMMLPMRVVMIYPEMVSYEDDPTDVRIDGDELYIGCVP